MAVRSGAMHVATIANNYTTKTGEKRRYESHLLRRTYREDGKVKHETLANVTALPGEQLDLLRRSLKGEKFVPIDTLRVTVERSLPHGDVALVMAQARPLGFPGLLGPASRRRDLALALIVSR